MTHPVSAKTIGFKIGFLAAGLCVAVCAPEKLAAQHCSEATTVRRYIVICDDYLSPAPKAPLVPPRLLAMSTSNVAGQIKASGTLSLGGQILTQIVSDTEKVNSDCTATVTYIQTINGQPGPPIRFTSVVSAASGRIDGISIHTGTAFASVLRRISRTFTAAQRPDSRQEGRPSQAAPSIEAPSVMPSLLPERSKQ
jgi:hypothetical protein